ncbi:MAG: methyltransferase domain-containing protein [Clostridiales bacterium]|nr:methyltransferase domain-containing protein [Clostridiales bacterium]
MTEQERIDDMGFGGVSLIQREDGFRYGIDAVLLATFAARSVHVPDRICDLGTGNGAAAMILLAKFRQAHVTGIEIQEEAASLARRSAALNGFEDRCRILTGDIRELPLGEERETFDLVVTNPPYVRSSGPMVSAKRELALARHEIAGGLPDFLDAAAALLRDRGTLCMIHRPARLTEILTLAAARRLEAKEILPVAPRRGKDPNLVLLRFLKNGGRELELHEPLYVYEGDSYSPEILALYERG